MPNFSERRRGEVLRIHLPRTPVNKGKRKGRSCYAPALYYLAVFGSARPHEGVDVYPCRG